MVRNCWSPIFAAISSAGFIARFPTSGVTISADVSRLYCGSFRGEALTCLLELIVQADQSILDVGLGTEDTIATTGWESRTSRAEAHKIVFGEYRPVRREHPFDTATSCPTSPVIRELANLRTRTIEKGYVRIGPRRAALRIEQHVRCDEIAAASRQSIEPMRMAIDGASEWYRRQRRALAQTCPIEHIAKAKHPRARLVIAADLTATSEATIARGD